MEKGHGCMALFLTLLGCGVTVTQQPMTRVRFTNSVVTGSTPVIPIIAAWVKIPTSPADNRLGKTSGAVFIYERDGNRV